MAKISYWNFPPEWEPLIKKILAWNDRYMFISVRKKGRLVSLRHRPNVSQRSVIPEAAAEWDTLNETQKNQWREAGAKNRQTSFQLYLQEYAQNKRYDLAPPASASMFAQNKVGRIIISNPAAGILLKQEHPYTYEVLRKVTGTRDMYEPVTVTELFKFPMRIGISWNSELTVVQATNYARMRVEVMSRYQGRDIITNYDIPFGYNDAWKRVELDLDYPKGRVSDYTVYIDIVGLQGRIDIDNLLLFHSGQNWGRDFRFNNFSSSYTPTFQRLAKHWFPEIQPPGAIYGSAYWRVI